MSGLARRSALPLYRYAIDWDDFERRHPPPDVFEQTLYRDSPEQLRTLQEERFRGVMEIGWGSPFHSRRWRDAGLEPGDVRTLADIGKLPTYTTEDVKQDQEANPPFGSNVCFVSLHDHLAAVPSKVQSSGGTTGKPRFTLNGPMEWEMMSLSTARSMYIQGARPGDVMQIPATCSLANLAWGYYSACHDYLGVLPLTTGSGIVTPTRKQLEIAFECHTNCWVSFPEYLNRLASACEEELGRSVRELGTKFIAAFLGADVDGTLREALEDRWGCPVYDNYGTNELGAGAAECVYQSGLHLMEDLNHFEVLDVESGEPAIDGEVGNLVVTNFQRTVQPVIRFDLRDLTRIVNTSACDCGSHFRRMDHLLGRSDSMVRLRAVNIYPLACLPAVRSDARTTGEWLCEVYVSDRDGTVREEMTVHIEARADAGDRDGLQRHLEARLADDLGVSVAVRLVDAGSLDSTANLGERKADRLLDRRAEGPKHS